MFRPATFGMFARDAQQQALSFLVSQMTTIEAEVNRILYPEIQYPRLLPVDTTGGPWGKSITFYSMDRVGKADWFHPNAKDMPLADVTAQKFEVGIEMAGIGYQYNLEEIQQKMLANLNLQTERAEAARRAADEMLDDIAWSGDASKGWTGFTNDPNVTVVTPLADGNNGNTVFADKTGDQMARDLNSLLSGVYIESRTIEFANTLLLPLTIMDLLASTPRSSNVDTTVLAWFKMNNVYTLRTGQPLTIESVRGLETAGDDGGGRAIAYRRDPSVVRFHLPMPHQFMGVWQDGPLVFNIPGIMRTGGVEIRRPASVRYLDGISDPLAT